MPNAPKTPNHSVRIPQDLWDAARAKAASRGQTITDVIAAYLRRYVR